MPHPQCDQCPWHSQLEASINRIDSNTVAIKEIQSQRNSLCAERGEQVRQLKENDGKHETDSQRQWESIDGIKKTIYIIMGIGIAVQSVITLWGKHLCK